MSAKNHAVCGALQITILDVTWPQLLQFQLTEPESLF